MFKEEKKGVCINCNADTLDWLAKENQKHMACGLKKILPQFISDKLAIMECFNYYQLSNSIWRDWMLNLSHSYKSKNNRIVKKEKKNIIHANWSKQSVASGNMGMLFCSTAWWDCLS